MTAVTAALESCGKLAGPLLPVLHAVQEALGFVPEGAVPQIAHALNLSRAEVHGTVSFYHWFRRRPPGRHILHLCRAEACQALGAGQLEAHAKRRLGIDFHGTTDDGAVTLEPVYCLGNCALGPSLLLDEVTYGRISLQRFDELIASVE